MYLEILHDAAAEYLKDEKISKQPSLSFNLTPKFYEFVQLEMNGLTVINSEVPIEAFTTSAIKFYGRTFTLVPSDSLDPHIERILLLKYTELFVLNLGNKK